MDLLTLTLGMLAGIASNAIAELALAPYLRRRMVEQVEARVEARVTKLRDELLAELKPGTMRGGVDPIALNERKAQVAAERAAAATLAEVEAKVFLAERLGPRGMEVARNVLGDDTLAKVFAAGDKWRNTLAPFLSKLPAPRQDNGVDAARSESYTQPASE